jgi:SAM-dependent methyltransferase
MLDRSDLNECLACGSLGLRLFLDLGSQPLANDFLPVGTELTNYPLALQVCGKCWHSQLTTAVNPELLFRNYLYVSGTTTTLRDYFDWFCDEVVEPVGSNLSILELASNDGSLLSALKSRGHQVLGVDPAANLMIGAAEKNVSTVCGFWPGDIAGFLASGFDLVIAMNVLAHVPNPAEFLAAAGRVLGPMGQIFIQTSQANMVRNVEFDTAYHEHLSFFNTSSMDRLARRADLFLVDAFYTPIHGTSYIWVLRREPAEPSARLLEMAENERNAGLFGMAVYERFANIAASTMEQTHKILSSLAEEGFVLWGYGAAAKGNTFINAAGITLAGIFDDNELKQGLVSPGGQTPVKSPDEIRNLTGKVCFLVPAWNFAEEIARRIRGHKPEIDGRLVVYFPTVRVLDLWTGEEIPAHA